MYTEINIPLKNNKCFMEIYRWLLYITRYCTNEINF